MIKEILSAKNTIELDELVDEYLESIGQQENAIGESYGETAARLGGDCVLEAAERRWFTVED